MGQADIQKYFMKQKLVIYVSAANLKNNVGKIDGLIGMGYFGEV